jgi:ADP-ribose pyrophosphatase YjhB (NUDIX family)
MTTPRPAHATLRIAVDLIIFTVRQGGLHVLLVERDNQPFRGQLALPGGFMRDGEGPTSATVRELREETDLDGSAFHLEQLEVFGAPSRDPRGRVVSIPYLANCAGSSVTKGRIGRQNCSLGAGQGCRSGRNPRPLNLLDPFWSQKGR